MKTALISILVFVGIVGAGIGLRFAAIGLGIITLPVNKLEKKVELNQGVIDKTYSTEYCLGNYEWFKDTLQDIQQTDSQAINVQEQIDAFLASAGSRDKWGFEEKQQYNRLTDQLTGIRNFKADLVGQYNSRTEQLNRVACKELPLFVKP